MAQVDPNLLGLLRTSDCLADAAVMEESENAEDEVGPHRHPLGVLIQLVICAMLWGGIIEGGRMFF